MDKVVHYEYPRQHDFIEEGSGKIQPWEALESMGAENIGHTLLRWCHGVNNSVLNTGYNSWHRVLGFKRESIHGGEAIMFYTHGDFGSKSGGTSMIHRFAKVIRFAGSTDIRVRFLMEREFISGANQKPYLIALLDRDYPEYRVPTYTTTRDAEIAVDMANHILSGALLFTDEEPSHPEEPPLTAHTLYQTFTSITPVQTPFTD